MYIKIRIMVNNKYGHRCILLNNLSSLLFQNIINLNLRILVGLACFARSPGNGAPRSNNDITLKDTHSLSIIVIITSTFLDQLFSPSYFAFDTNITFNLKEIKTFLVERV